MLFKFAVKRSTIQSTISVVKNALNQYAMVPDVDGSREGGHKGQSFSRDFGSDMPFSSGSSRSGSSHNQPLRFPSRINKESEGTDGKQLARDIYQRQEQGAGQETQADNDRSSSKQQPNRQQGNKEFWQLHNAYIVTQTRSGMCMVDQYRAHKRIIYEKALQAAESSLPSTQQLLFSQTVELSATDFSLLEELQPVIQRMGFNVELMSGNTAMVQGVPADIDMGDEKSVLTTVLQQYQRLDNKVKLNKREKVAIAFASKAAINRGRELTKWEMETLIDQLFACEEPYKDPLDNPTLIYFPLEEIQSRFS
jgi:DNA mismatch repair protein MutL